MLKAIKLWYLKGKLRSMYMRYLALRDDYSCGEKMFLELSGEGFRLKRKMEALFDRCQELEAA